MILEYQQRLTLSARRPRATRPPCSRSWAIPKPCASGTGRRSPGWRWSRKWCANSRRRWLPGFAATGRCWRVTTPSAAGSQPDRGSARPNWAFCSAATAGAMGFAREAVAAVDRPCLGPLGPHGWRRASSRTTAPQPGCWKRRLFAGGAARGDHRQRARRRDCAFYLLARAPVGHGERHVIDQQRQNAGRHQFGDVPGPGRHEGEQAGAGRLGAQEAVIGAQRPVGDARHRRIEQGWRRQRAAGCRHRPQPRAQGQIQQCGDDAAMLDEEEDELRIGKVISDVGRHHALQRAAQAPEIAQLIGELVAGQQRDDQRDRGPVAEIERQRIAQAQPAAIARTDRSSKSSRWQEKRRSQIRANTVDSGQLSARQRRQQQRHRQRSAPWPSGAACRIGRKGGLTTASIGVPAAIQKTKGRQDFCR